MVGSNSKCWQNSIEKAMGPIFQSERDAVKFRDCFEIVNTTRENIFCTAGVHHEPRSSV